MREITDDPFYEILKQYNLCGVDYGLFQSSRPYRGERSHREALAQFMRRISEKEAVSWEYDVEKAEAVKIGADSLFFAPKALRGKRRGDTIYDCGYRNSNNGGKIPYWYAFLEPPHGNGYAPEDFQKANRALFPAGTDSLEIYEWTTDWSDFFDEGHEWWGASCWSVYDGTLDRYAVIAASATD